MKTSKAQYDEEMAMINAAKMDPGIQEPGPDDDDDDEELEDESEPERPAQAEVRPIAASRTAERSALASLERFNRYRKASHLKSDEAARLAAFLRRYEKRPIEHPLVGHLVGEKVKLAKRHLEAEARAKELYQELLRQVARHSDDALKVCGAIEHVDRQLLTLIDEHPEWAKDDGPPPAA